MTASIDKPERPTLVFVRSIARHIAVREDPDDLLEHLRHPGEGRGFVALTAYNAGTTTLVNVADIIVVAKADGARPAEGDTGPQT